MRATAVVLVPRVYSCTNVVQSALLRFLWLQAATDAAGAFPPSPSFPDASPDKELCVCFVLLVDCQPHQTFDNNGYFKSGVDEGLDHTAPIYVCCALLARCHHHRWSLCQSCEDIAVAMESMQWLWDAFSSDSSGKARRDLSRKYD